MLKPTTKLSPILVQVYALFFIGILFFFSHCSARVEEDEVENKKSDLENQNRGTDEQGKFKNYLENTIHLQETASDRNEVRANIELAIDLINKNAESLNKDPKSTDNALYVLLEAIATVTGSEGLGAQEGTKMEGYIKIFKLLREKRFELDGTLLGNLKKKAIDFKSESKASLFYPLVVLGGIEPDTKVFYFDEFGTKRNTAVYIITWALLNKELNKESKKEMVAALTNPANKETHRINSTKETKVQNDVMTPAMFAARQASTAENDEDAAYWREIFKLFLREAHIKFMDMGQKSEINGDPTKLKDQPLLSFIIYNCVYLKVQQYDKWLDILGDALKIGDLAGGSKKKEIEKYVHEYIDKKTSSAEQHFDDDKLYDQDKVKEVRKKLEEYVGHPIPIK